MSRTPIVLLSLLALAVSARAQVTPVAGTGCAPLLVTAVQGAPTLGSQVTISNSLPCPGLAVVGVGFTQVSAPITTCSGRPCTVGIVPLVTGFGSPTAQVVVTIPPLPILVGVCVVAQAGCLAPGCIDVVEVAVQICVM